MTLEKTLERLQESIREAFEKYLEIAIEKIETESGGHYSGLKIMTAKERFEEQYEEPETYSWEHYNRKRNEFYLNLARKEMPKSVRNKFETERKEIHRIEKEIEKLKSERAYENREVVQGKGRKGRDKSRGAGQRASRKAQKERLLELKRKLKGNKK